MVEKPKFEPLNVRVQLLVTESIAYAVDTWGFDRRIRSRNEAVRQLIEIGLEASEELEKQKQEKGLKPKR
jgi:metal-responsive CopG/Arc/MetJ family transcriptional regulator